MDICSLYNIAFILTMGEVVINLKNITFGYPSRPKLLNGLDFTLKRGERIGLTGPNGSGKTTFLHIIMGLLKPFEGEIEIFGKVRKNEEDFREVRKRIGLLFQNSDDQLFCPSVYEEVAFAPLNFGKSKEEVDRIVKKVLNLVGLEGFEKMPPYHLSGGEKRRLALGTVLAMEPEILLLDEPTLELDEDGVERLLKALKKQELSYIVVSQDREFLKSITHPIYAINEGKIKRIY